MLFKMKKHFSMGAINKTSNNYEYPKIADKKNIYECPTCKNNVIFRKGPIMPPHFAHYKSNNPCYYYNKPTETQIHKDAKMLMKTLLDERKQIHIDRICYKCENVKQIIIHDYYLSGKIYQSVIEYSFLHYNVRRHADIALLEDGELKFIFEICNKSKTKEENRPEPWVELDAEQLIYNINMCDNNNLLIIPCIRKTICTDCINSEQLEKKRQNEKREKDLQEQLDYTLLNEKINILQSTECKCGIVLNNLCICKEPNYKNFNNNLFCLKCNRWKCRCE